MLSACSCTARKLYEPTRQRSIAIGKNHHTSSMKKKLPFTGPGIVSFTHIQRVFLLLLLCAMLALLLAGLNALPGEKQSDVTAWSPRRWIKDSNHSNSNVLLSPAPGGSKTGSRLSSRKNSSKGKRSTRGAEATGSEHEAPQVQQKHSVTSAAAAAAAATAPVSDPPPIPGMLTPERCPAWMSQYVAFHRQQRGQPGAKYLLYAACPGKSGLGDRIRGMMYLTRQAVALNRIILFTWRGAPHEAERYLPPAGPINWTLDGIQGYDYPETNTYCTGNESMPDVAVLKKYPPSRSISLKATDYQGSDAPARRFIKSGGLRQLHEHQFIAVHTNEYMTKPCAECPALDDPTPAPVGKHKAKGKKAQPNNTAACLFRYLFGISADVQTAAQQHLVQLYGAQAAKPDFRFLAMHMRLGGMKQEKSLRSSKGGADGPLLDLIHGLACMQKLGQRVGINITQVPLLLFTDHHDLRDFVKAGMLANVITSAVTPTHLARMSDKEAADPEAAISSYVDLALLARARCAVYSRSGFSATAWMLGGGTDCYEHFSRGLKGCLKRKDQPKNIEEFLYGRLLLLFPEHAAAACH